MAVFVAFEGVEGSGKSTQVHLLYERMLARHLPVVKIREPGSTPLGDHLRSWLKEEASTTPRAELFLFCAARNQLVTEVIRPALGNGSHVISDRYSGSTIAYQAHGRGLGEEVVRPLLELATEGVEPDLYVLLDVDRDAASGMFCAYCHGVKNSAPIDDYGAPSEYAPLCFCSMDEEVMERVGRRTGSSQSGFGSLSGKEPDVRSGSVESMDDEGQRFEEEPLEFHQRVRDGYIGLAKADPETWLVLDATKSPEELSDLIWERVQALLSR